MGNEPTARDKLDAMLAWDRMEAWTGWEHAEFLDLRCAACLLTVNAPSKFENNRILPSQARAMLSTLQGAIVTGSLRPFAAWEYTMIDWERRSLIPLAAEEISPHTDLAENTTVRVADLASWCNARGIPHPWADAISQRHIAMATYPDELRAAIEAFEAVHGDPATTAKRSPKAALTAWLEANKPELSANARERIATVANWQPTGGAPKTPGE